MDVVVVRTRSPADLPAAVAALRGVHVADGYPMRWPHDPADWLTPGRLTDAWVAVPADGDTVLGHAVLTAAEPDDAAVRLWLADSGGEPGDVAVLGRLFSTAAARGRGVARRLIDTAAAAARGRGQRLVLDVLAADPAVGYYEHLGWRFLGSTELAFGGGRHPVRCYAGPAAGDSALPPANQ